MYNKLPYEIIEIIKYYYWNFQFNNVINEIKYTIQKNNEIEIFLKKFYNYYFHNHLLFYYKKFNYIIKDIVNNNGKFLLLKHNNLFLRYCSLNSINAICNGIKEDYKYITPLLIVKSSYNRYKMIEKIKSF